MILNSIDNIYAMCDEESAKKYYGTEFGNLTEVKAWAVKYIYYRSDNDNYYPIVNNTVLSWCYDAKVVDNLLKLLETLHRDSTMLVIESVAYPLAIKIGQHYSESQKYFLVSPRLEEM